MCLFIWVGGMRRGLFNFVTSYIPTSGSTVTRAADVYTSTSNLTETFEPRGLLIEEARTNYTNNHNATNQSSGATETVAVATAPDGTQTATRVAETTANNRHIRYQAQNNFPANSTALSSPH